MAVYHLLSCYYNRGTLSGQEANPLLRNILSNIVEIKALLAFCVARSSDDKYKPILFGSLVELAKMTEAGRLYTKSVLFWRTSYHIAVSSKEKSEASAGLLNITQKRISELLVASKTHELVRTCVDYIRTISARRAVTDVEIKSIVLPEFAQSILSKLNNNRKFMKKSDLKSIERIRAMMERAR